MNDKDTIIEALISQVKELKKTNNELTKDLNVVKKQQCCVCLENMEEYGIVKLDCKHNIHIKCFLSIIGINANYSKKCPYCRQKFTDKSFIELLEPIRDQSIRMPFQEPLHIPSPNINIPHPSPLRRGRIIMNESLHQSIFDFESNNEFSEIQLINDDIEEIEEIEVEVD